VPPLLASHGLAHALNLLSFLYEGAKPAEPVQQTVRHETPLDALGVSDLLADLGTRVHADAAEERHDAIVAAALAHRLGVLARRVARHEVRDDAQPAVVEAREQPVFPVAHDGLLFAGGKEK